MLMREEDSRVRMKLKVKDEGEQVGDERLKGDRHQVSERTNNNRSTPK
jgi:hypothetical protein